MRHRLKAVVLITGLMVSWLTGSSLVLSSEHERQWADEDHAYDRARRAVDRGETLPIGHLLKRLEVQVPGEVVGVEFGQEQGRWVYEFKVIDDGGRLLEVNVDAKTGAVLLLQDD